ncbi:MAG: DUF732 domain-containing protein [Mycobacterium sp.]
MTQDRYMSRGRVHSQVLRQLGYQVTDRQLALSNAHEACRLFRQGEPAAEVNQEMAARMHASLDATLMLTSSAMLSYPDC